MITRELHAAAIAWIQANLEHSFPDEATPTEVAKMLDAYATEEQIPVDEIVKEIQAHARAGAVDRQADLFDQSAGGYLD